MPRRIVVLCLLGSLVVATAAARAGGAPPRPAVPGLGAVESASRIVDRTFTCAPRTFGGLGDLDVNVSPFVDYGTFERSAYLIVSTGGSNPQDNLVFVRPRSQDELGGWRAGPAGVYASSRRCAGVRGSIPLSSTGLAGPPTRWEKDLNCPVRGRVLVRVRSVLRSPAGWRRIDGFFHGARRPVVEAKIAVRVQRTGEPVAYMEYGAKGAVTLWYSSGCS